MLPSKPFKFICQKCGFSKIVIPKSDVLNIMDMITICPKCGNEVVQKELNIFDYVKSIFK
ncbi:MAG: hypothetical protein HXX81_00425 [Campylobacterales bacterium]|nr:hypothetical protein [Campylobacterales bacterium]